MGIFKRPDLFDNKLVHCEYTMRIKHLMMVPALLMVATGGAFVFHSGMHRGYLQKLRTLVNIEKYNKKSSGIQPLIKKNIFDHLKYLEIDESSIKVRYPTAHDSTIEICAAVPCGKPKEWILWYLSSACDGTAYRVDDCFCPSNERECKIHFISAKSHEPAFVLTISWSSRYYSKTAKMAVIITDFGFSADRTTTDYLSFEEPLTVALLPSRKLSSWTAQISKEYRKEIIILLPMEGKARLPPAHRSSLIMVHFTEAHVRSIIERAVESIPHFSGFSNVSGNRILEDTRVMSIIFSEIKKRQAYFVEESMAGKTLTPAMSKNYGVPFVQVFRCADTSLTTSELRNFIRRCAQEAQKRGAIVISSGATQSFIFALKSEASALKENGVRLSYVSELLREARDEKE